MSSKATCVLIRLAPSSPFMGQAVPCLLTRDVCEGLRILSFPGDTGNSKQQAAQVTQQG